MRCLPGRRALAPLALALLVVTGLSACEPARPRVIVYGDSLVFEARREITQWAAARGYDTTIRTRFGGAPCSFFGQMQDDRAARPAAVIVTFVQSLPSLEPCVGPDPAISYRDQITVVKAIWTGSGTRVVWAAAPAPRPPGTEVGQDAMRSEAYRRGLPVVDGGKYVTPGRVWAWTQPCMTGERCVGPQVNPAVAPGRNIVRANDGVHFCPGTEHGFKPCGYYMSGGWRFARAITEGLAV